MHNLYDSPQPDLLSDDGLALTEKTWEILRGRGVDFKLAELEIQPLTQFKEVLAAQPQTSEADRMVILEQARILFENFYAHLAFKKERLQVDPAAELEKLTSQLSTLAEHEFHSEMLRIFGLVQDAHTAYTLPPPLNQMLAFLPFQVGAVVQTSWSRHAVEAAPLKGEAAFQNHDFVVTRVLETEQGKGFGHKSFGPGAILHKWNGVDIWEVVDAADVAGGNPSARLARGLGRTTIRPLGQLDMPDTEIVTLEYYPVGSDASDPTQLETIQLKWGIARGFGAGVDVPGSAFSMNNAQQLCSDLGRLMYAPQCYSAPDKIAATEDAALPPEPKGSPLESGAGEISPFPFTFEIQHSGGTERAGLVKPSDLNAKNPDGSVADKKFAYVRIRRFQVPAPEDQISDLLVSEFHRILVLLNEKAPDGLIIDLRGNPGGDIEGAERMLQLLISTQVTPAGFSFPNTPTIRLILEMVRVNRGVGRVRAPAPPGPAGKRLTSSVAHFRDWLTDTSEEADRLTVAQPLSKRGTELQLGKPYRGPVTLVVDGMTYSAADIFAGGFADHHVGKIVGVGPTTGGGGGSVWTHANLLDRTPVIPNVALRQLPGEQGKRPGMTLAALRSLRVPYSQEIPIEDIGVSADEVYEPTFDDVINGYGGLFGKLCQDFMNHAPPGEGNQTAAA